MNFNLTPERWVLVGALAAALIVGSLVLLWLFKRLPKRLKRQDFSHSWKELQRLLSQPETWPEAVIRADALLDKALKKRSFRGKSMGARLVNAQRLFSDNDAVWFAHKLRIKLEQRPGTRLKQDDVKEALIGIRQALRDLGAL